MTTPSTNGIINTLISAGALTAAGGVVAAIVNALSGRGESLAKAADAIANAARGTAEGAGAHASRIDQQNAELREENTVLRDVARSLSGLLEQAPPELAEKAAEVLADVRDKL